MAEDIVDILVTNYNDNVTLDIQPNVTVVNISNLSGLTGIIIPSGTVGKLPYYDTSTTFADSNIFTDGTSVGINNPTPTFYSTNRGMVLRNGTGNVEMILQHDGNTAASIQGLTISNVKTDGAYIFNRENLHLTFGTNDTARIKILPSGRVLMGSTLPTDDATNALQVNGGIYSYAGIKSVNTIQSNDQNAYWLFQSGNSTDYKLWAIQNLASTGTFRVRALNDGASNGINAIEIIRTDITSVITAFNGGSVYIGKSSGSSKFGISGLPTSASGLSSGDIWNDSGTLKIV